MSDDTPIPPADLRELNAALTRCARALDREIAASGAVDRVGARVRTRIAARPFRRTIWFAIAATLIIAAGLGSLADFALINGRDDTGQQVVVMDPLVFGTTVVEQQ